MKKNILTVCLVTAFTSHAFAFDFKTDDLLWKAVTFGQSTDLNFGSSILPGKVGLNQVTVNGQLINAGALEQKFTIESRGGKLANSHEGLTFYYTEIPTDYNFRLSADIELIQLGPETGATPNRQEGAGIMVRDIISAERLMPQPEGHEEFPSASNMVMNLLRSHTRSNDSMTNINASFREGVYQPWGTAGNKRTQVDYVQGVNYGQAETYRMTLARNDIGFEVSYQQGDKIETYAVNGANANIVEIQNAQSQYIGFFASRNAKINVSNIDLTLSAAETVDAEKFIAKQDNLVFEIASSHQSATAQYPIQARANYTGKFAVSQSGKVIADAQLNAGELFSYSTLLTEGDNNFTVSFTALEGPNLETISESLTVTKVAVNNANAIFVSPSGTEKGTGSLSKPLDLASAIALVPAGGTIKLLAGDYPTLTLPISVSGTAEQPKYLKATEEGVRFTGDLTHDANYWHYDGIEVAGARFIVHGSHNTFEKMVTHSAPDTGFQITSPENIGRSLWASYNTVIDSESFNNMDPSQINADGFAAKMRVGDGNTFIRCIAHHNIDDGWDLFNKVEDGPNGVVTILDSIAFNNGRTLNVANKGGTIGNGFKLGGEGIPVAHVIKNSLSFNNNMDGFTDNFNPGSITVNNNVAIDNKRFNYLFRQSPYSDDIKQGTFLNNVSYRFNIESRYDDAVNSQQAEGNLFIQNGKTVDQLGKVIDLEPLTLMRQTSVIDLEHPVPGMAEALKLKELMDL